MQNPVSVFDRDRDQFWCSKIGYKQVCMVSFPSLFTEQLNPNGVVGSFKFTVPWSSLTPAFSGKII